MAERLGLSALGTVALERPEGRSLGVFQEQQYRRQAVDSRCRGPSGVQRGRISLDSHHRWRALLGLSWLPGIVGLAVVGRSVLSW